MGPTFDSGPAAAFYWSRDAAMWVEEVAAHIIGWFPDSAWWSGLLLVTLLVPFGFMIFRWLRRGLR